MKKYKRKKKYYKGLYAIIILIIGLIYSSIGSTLANNETINQTSSGNLSTLKVTYLDVGQADSILIQTGEENMLIDAGNNNDGELLVNYFNSLNIKDFTYVVGTHPHEDHIGGLDDIINSFTIKTLFLPDVTTTTSTFTQVMDAMEKKNLKFTVPNINDTYKLGDATITVIYVGEDEKDLNNSSIVLRLDYGKTRFLFTGDATKEVEEVILDEDIQADVLKVGHHGSKYSTSSAFLKKVNPKYAIISVGSGNSYGHPNESTLNLLKKNNIEIYRTDEMGSIVVMSDGNNITISEEKTNTNGG